MPAEPPGGKQRAVQRRVAVLEQQPLLRVHRATLGRRNAKGARVEALRAGNEAAVTHARRLRPAQHLHVHALLEHPPPSRHAAHRIATRTIGSGRHWNERRAASATANSHAPTASPDPPMKTATILTSAAASNHAPTPAADDHAGMDAAMKRLRERQKASSGDGQTPEGALPHLRATGMPSARGRRVRAPARRPAVGRT